MDLNSPIIVPIENRHHRLYTVAFYSVCILLGAFIFSSPFPYMTTLNGFFFYTAAALGTALAVFRAIPVVVKTPLTLPFLLFFLWSCLSLIWALNFDNTLNDLRRHLLYYLILFFMVINFFNSRTRLHWLAWVLVFSAVVFSVVSVVFYYVIMDSSIAETRLGYLLPDGRHVWRELSVNMIGALTIPAFLFCFYFFRKASGILYKSLLIINAGIILVATTLTQSRGTLTALLVTGIIFLLIKNRKLLPLFLAIIILIAVLSPFKNRTDMSTLFERLKINNVFLQVVKDYPLKGIGFGVNTYFENVDIKGYISKVPDHWKPLVPVIGPHSWLLDIMIRTGIIGFSLFLFILFMYLKMSWQVVRKARDPVIRDMAIYVSLSFLSYFIVGLAEPLFWESAPIMYFYVLMSMMTILWLLNQGESPITNGSWNAPPVLTKSGVREFRE